MVGVVIVLQLGEVLVGVLAGGERLVWAIPGRVLAALLDDRLGKLRAGELLPDLGREEPPFLLVLSMGVLVLLALLNDDFPPVAATSDPGLEEPALL
eukprot:7441753-Alexandrium_andersonii.AAC.1